MPLRATPVLVVGLVGLAVLLPLFGASLVVVLLLDQLVLRGVPALSGWFSTSWCHVCEVSGRFAAPSHAPRLRW